MDYCWMDFVASGKKPLILIAKSSGSGITKGNIYKSWAIKKSMFLIFNDRGNAVFSAKGYFKVIDGGSVLPNQ